MVVDPKQGPLRSFRPELVAYCRWCQGVLLKEDVYCPWCGKARDYGTWVK